MQNPIETLEVGDLFETENGDLYVVTQLVEKGQVAAKKLSEEEFVSIDAIKAINGTLRK
ncbi:hypothetical protein [Scandinavium goeteborgense]|uniref:hypothetical protein n=1 Tax=Scandinavium goeteborgense TaxID=1851514 RepID=UPI001444FC4A|nr:hypothetical protein [Scandinavium goeteborgense]QKN81318.1 hypothetical protein A8O29_008515 [Scandinavium goeteborgense]